MTFSAEMMFHRSPKLLAAEVDGELVIMDAESSHYFNLDTIGAAIWQRLENPVGFDALCLDLHQRYDAPLDRIRQDVAALLSELQAHKLVLTSAP